MLIMFLQVSDANSEQENEAVHTGDDVSHDSGGGEEGNVGGDATSRPDSVDMVSLNSW